MQLPRNAPAQPPPRYFTPDEANALLPRVRTLMTKATESNRRIRERLKMLETSEASDRERMAQEISSMRDEAMACVNEMQRLGVEVKGLEAGLVDFPALRNGEYVYLCWRVGESKVEWWHPISTGFSGRQRVTLGAGVRWEWRN